MSKQLNSSSLIIRSNMSSEIPEINLHRNMNSIVGPIRQTASIFKQPVTIYRNHESTVNENLSSDGNQEKPKQLLWEKRLEKIRPRDENGNEFGVVQLPRGLKSIGPHVSCDETVIKSVTTALHMALMPVLGQSGSKSSLERNPSVFLDPKQPLLQAVTIGDDDIRRQEEKVHIARRKLEEILS